MEKSELLPELIKIVKSKAVTKRQAETIIGLPKNSLSNILSGKKELPKKYIDRAIAFIAEHQTDKKEEVNNKDAEIEYGSEPWIDAIRNYCLEKGIDPMALISYPLTTEEAFPPNQKNTNISDAIEIAETIEPPMPDSKNVPAGNAEDIRAKIKAVRAENIPKERDTLWGRRSWQKEQNDKISELQKLLQ